MEHVLRRPDKSGVLEKLEDGSRQTRRLPRLGTKYEVSQIVGEVVQIEPGRLPEQTGTVSRQSEDEKEFSPPVGQQ